jgi:hypothetical protein
MTVENIDYDFLKIYIEEIENEIEVIKQTFSATVNSEGANSFTPFFLFLSSPLSKNYIVQSHPCDIYKSVLNSFSDILNLFSSSKSYSVIISLDFAIEDSSDLEYENVLKIVFATEMFLTQIDFPYIYDEEGNVVFLDHLAIQYNDTDINEELKDIYAILYLHTHAESSPFTESEILSYLTFQGNLVIPCSEDSQVSYINFNEQEVVQALSSSISKSHSFNENYDE